MGLKMPIYEFWCSSCEQKVSIYQQSFATISHPRALAEWVTRTSRGDKVPAECEETIGKLAKGEWPTKNSEPSDDE
jgi:hypothetical protein